MNNFRIGDRVSYTYEDRHGNEGHDTGRVVGVDPASGTVSIWWDWSNEATSEDLDDPDIIITGRSDLRAIGVVVAMVAAASVKTALYRQTLRCFGADDGQHWCYMCKQHVT
jgi:hypothetical protein